MTTSAGWRKTAGPAGSPRRWPIWSTGDLSQRSGEAWRRFRLRGRADQRFLGVLRALAAWRETAAQQRDLPRGRIMRDEALLEIARACAKDDRDAGAHRSLGKGIAEGKLGPRDPAAVTEGLADPDPPPAIAARAESPPPEVLAALLQHRNSRSRDRILAATRPGRRWLGAVRIRQALRSPRQDLAAELALGDPLPRLRVRASVSIVLAHGARFPSSASSRMMRPRGRSRCCAAVSRHAASARSTPESAGRHGRAAESAATPRPVAAIDRRVDQIGHLLGEPAGPAVFRPAPAESVKTVRRWTTSARAYWTWRSVSGRCAQSVEARGLVEIGPGPAPLG